MLKPLDTDNFCLLWTQEEESKLSAAISKGNKDYTVTFNTLKGLKERRQHCQAALDALDGLWDAFCVPHPDGGRPRGYCCAKVMISSHKCCALSPCDSEEFLFGRRWTQQNALHVRNGGKKNGTWRVHGLRISPSCELKIKMRERWIYSFVSCTRVSPLRSSHSLVFTIAKSRILVPKGLRGHFMHPPPLEYKRIERKPANVATGSADVFPTFAILGRNTHVTSTIFSWWT